MTQFESEATSRLNALSKACAFNINLSEVCDMTNKFISWIEVSSEELEVACLKEAKMNFHARISGIVEPLMQKVNPAFLLSTPVLTPPPSSVQASLVASESSLEVVSVSGAKKTMVTDEFILENFECLAVASSEVKEQLKLQSEKKNKLSNMLGQLLSRIPPPSKL